MNRDYDIIIAGLGAMGSAAAFHLAGRGTRVLGLDRFRPPHEFGSSHGLTRIIREAYFEHPSYVPLVQRAYELWGDLEKQSGRRLLLQTGGVMLGAPEGVLVKGAQLSAQQHSLQHRVLSANELHRRFPAFQPTPDMVGVWEPRAGVLFPESAIQSHLHLAAQKGAELRFDEPLLKWAPEGGGVRVQTPAAIYTGRQLLLTVGAWIGSMVPELNLPLTVERQVLYWFQPLRQAEVFQPAACPIYICEHAPRKFFYGFPDLGDGIKVAVHHQGEATQPENVRREVGAHEVESMRSLLRQFFPAADGPLKATKVCIYTNTPDEHFLLDRHPLYPQVLLASPCSGHGFKFSSAIGELAAITMRGQQPSLDLGLFKISRFVEG